MLIDNREQEDISDGFVDTELAIILLEDDIVCLDPLRPFIVVYDSVLRRDALSFPTVYDWSSLCL